MFPNILKPGVCQLTHTTSIRFFFEENMTVNPSQKTVIKGSNLFKPIKLGEIELSHRVVLAPLTRLRNDPETYAPNVKIASEYYSQRSQRPGSLVTTEGLSVEEAVGYFPGVPGIWSDEQAEAWSKVFETIHKNKSFVIAQLFSLGRQAHPAELANKGFEYTAPSPIYIKENPDYPNFENSAQESNNPLRALTLEEIEQHVVNFVSSAKRILKAGADGVQVHVANGYLLNQFLDPSTNQRTDQYGGSIENRSRLILEIIDRLIEEVGSSKISIRLSPYGVYGGLKGGEDPTLIAQYAHLVGELEVRAKQGHRLQFIDLVEPRYITQVNIDEHLEYTGGTTDFISSIWKGPIIKAGNYGSGYDAILKEVEDDRVLIAVGRHYISNPDLPDRLENGYPLTKYDRTTFYAGQEKGYTDYPRYS